MKNAIIFGASGQDGFYLRRYLLTLGYRVSCFSRSTFPDCMSIDIGNYDQIESAIIGIKPDLIFHLAAKSSVQHDHILENQNSVVDGALCILEVVDRHLPKAKVFLASSGLVFENQNKPISVNSKLIVSSAYTLSRIQSLEISRYYRARGRFIYTGFLFNHESPRRPAASVARSIAKNVVEISRDNMDELSIGNSSVIKEWLWAGDAVRAMHALLMQEHIFEACIADGIGHSIKTYAKKCCEYLDLDISQFLRSSNDFLPQFSMLVGDSMPMRGLGWKPSIDIDGLVKIMIDAELVGDNSNLYQVPGR